MALSDFWQRVLTQSTRQADHVGHSLVMVGTLPGVRARIEDTALSTACLESWLVHVRLLAEFLLVHPAGEEKDFSAHDFGWDGKTRLDTREIRRMWKVASQHLVHFSRERTPANVYALKAEDVSPDGLRRISRLVLDLAEEFVTALERDHHSDAQKFRGYLAEADEGLRRPA